MSTQDLLLQSLVSTKLFIPPLPSTLLPRPQAMHKLHEALSHKLTLISAQAGSGKTTLLREWTAQAAQPVAWLSLAETDNDPARFWAYLVASCQTVQAVVGQRLIDQLQSPEPPPVDMLLPALINDLASVSQPFVLILDDYHTITESAIHRTLRLLLDQQPPSLHIVLSTRADPPLALARRRTRGEMAELRTTDMRFTLEETTTWFTRILHLPLTPAQIASLYERTEGWAAALHLASLSLHNSANPEETLADFTGSHRFVMDYLLDEVLASQPEDVRTFLLHTAFLERLTGPLCDALTGRSDGQATLEGLERANLFLLPLDEQRRWYRYHQLFAEALRLRASRVLGTEQQATLSLRASAWYEQHNLLFEAVETALLARDFDTALRIGNHVVPQLLLAGQHATVARWIQQLPHTLYSSQPLLCLALAWTHLLLGQRAAALEPLRKVEQHFTRTRERQGLGRVAAVRALLARLERDGEAAIHWGQRALALLAEETIVERSVSVIALGYGHRLQGEIHMARQALAEARLLSEQVGSKSGMLGCTLLLGELLTLEGQLSEAALCYRQVIEAGETWMPLAIEAHLALGTLLLEWNELDAITAHLERALRLSHQYEERSLVAQTVLLQARVFQAKGMSDQAEESFWRAVVLARQSKRSQLLAVMYAYQMRWWLTQGNLQAGRDFRATCGLAVEDAPAYEREAIALTLARVLLAQGETDEVRRLLKRWLELATTQRRVGSQIEILLLDVRAADAQGQIPEALLLLQQALLLAAERRYCRLFVEEGSSLTRLLRLLQLRWRGKAGSDYLEYLLGVMPVDHPVPVSPATSNTRMPLLSPLTPREYKVLRLLAAGLSTREIASELVVSLNTIKTQVQSLYRKLDANSREEALAAARSWQLL